MPEIGVAGQEVLRDSHVLIVGAGGLGAPAALYLAAAGVGRLTLADSDALELSNLQRQILYRENDLGRPKALSAQQQLNALNPDVKVEAVSARIDAAALDPLVQAADIVLDGSDNFPTRYAVNAACVAARKPLISGAAIRLEGQLAVFTPGRGDSPCYACLYPPLPPGDETQERCEDSGILGPVAGVIGTLQATAALRLRLGIGASASGQLWLFDARGWSMRQVRIPRDPHCAICGEPA